MVKGSYRGHDFSIGQLDRLPWRDLAQVCTDAKVPAYYRKVAEKRLSNRIETLALGEQVALARIAPRAVLADLVRLREPAVVDAFLGNPRTTFADIAELLRDPKMPPQALRNVAEHHRWGDMVPVHILLVTHFSTPVHTALTVLAKLPEEDVRRLLAAGSLPPVVAIQARRLHVGKNE